MACHSAGGVGFVEVGYSLFQRGGRILNVVRIAKTRASSDIPQFFVAKRLCKRINITKIPRFQFLAHNPHKRIVSATFGAKLR